MYPHLTILACLFIAIGVALQVATRSYDLRGPVCVCAFMHLLYVNVPKLRVGFSFSKARQNAQVRGEYLHERVYFVGRLNRFSV